MITQQGQTKYGASFFLLLLYFGCVSLVFQRFGRTAKFQDTSEKSHGNPLYDTQIDSEGIWVLQVPDQAQQEKVEAPWKSLEGIATFAAMLDALQVMQSHFYSIPLGQWPNAIDWTAAVLGTHVSATLSSMTASWYKDDDLQADAPRMPTSDEPSLCENEINRYFTHITSFYFGENAFSLRTQAYDDMLWVVLGWLESVKFVSLHSKIQRSLHSSVTTEMDEMQGNISWYGEQFVPQFAHRARLFYDLASKGWDTTLCGGGMVWNPYLAPYKNAITNELFIAASVEMYLHFPGDDNASPFVAKNKVAVDTALPPAKAHDMKYLENAIEAYQWLKTSKMKNAKGLYVDGFHIKGWRGGRNGSGGSGKCDIRSEMVYTYNQGVILSGLRGLWDATGSKEYLDDGHELINNVIKASGWESRGTRWRWRWAGLGRNGVMEDTCDSHGTCSQNGHTFKGIFFHHLRLFCAPMDVKSPNDGDDMKSSNEADEQVIASHWKRCATYEPWIRHNAQAAYMTRDENGEIGTWWGVRASDTELGVDGVELSPKGGTDYRNDGVPLDELWRLPEDEALQGISSADMEVSSRKSREGNPVQDSACRDPNDRGRGRTVESHSGGLAVIRAAWSVANLKK
ncbi:MAG: hypothetical protein Q9167_001989 [Letrouitia subvulpina]